MLRFLRTRDDLLAFGLLVGLCAFLVVPAAHLINHRPDHTHTHGTGAAHSHDPAPGDRQVPAPAHGAGSFEHFGVALTATTIFVLLLLAAPVIDRAVASLQSILPKGRDYRCARPRGPPAAAFAV